jgi:hypothetical protein
LLGVLGWVLLGWLGGRFDMDGTVDQASSIDGLLRVSAFR